MIRGCPIAILRNPLMAATGLARSLLQLIPIRIIYLQVILITI